MRTIIAGSRSIRDYGVIERAIELSGFTISVVISGTARGVDVLGERWARENGIPIEQFRPDWDVYGAAAGPIRNKQMAERGEALIAVMEPGGTVGTLDMVKQAKKRNLPTFVYYID